MKSLSLLSLIIMLITLTTCKKNTHAFKDPIEKPSPSIDVALPFAEHIFSKFSNVRDFTINTTENEAYFSLQSPARELSVIMKIIKENGIWKAPEISHFSGQYTDLEPFLSPDNLRLYFASNRPISEDSTNIKDIDIWYVDRKSIDSEWSQPKNIGAPINTDADEFYPAVATNGNLYFTSIKKELDSEDDIFLSKFKNGIYTEPVPLGASINTKGAEFNAFIAPDESYLIFGGWRRDDGVGSGDLYLSINVNGEWSKAKNLGVEINSKQTDFCPFVSSRSNTLFFTSRRSNVAQKENGFTNTEELLSEINRYDNGFSRIYKLNFDTYLNK